MLGFRTNITMKYLFLSLISLVSLILSSCAVYSQGSFQAQQDPTSVSPVLSAGEGDARVVFYRLGEDFPLPVSIYINGHYFTTLHSGRYAELEACAVSQRLGIFVVGMQPYHFVKSTYGVDVVPTRDEVTYFRIDTTQYAETFLKQVDAVIAQQEVGHQQQGGAMSRVTKERACINSVSINQ